MTTLASVRIASSGVIAHSRLDRRLEILARRPERFARDAIRLGAAFDARGFDLEISDPSCWRGTTGSQRVAVENQFHSEIEGVRTLDREEERSLAVRIEFAKLRLERALGQHGVDPGDLPAESRLPPKVLQRKREWHALRLEMVERNLYLVLIHVQRYRHKSVDRSDLIQAAVPALFRAVDGFDWRRGLLFRTYAVHWLNKGFRSQLYDSNNTVRVPAYLQVAHQHVSAALQRLDDPHASVEAVASATGLRTSTIGLAHSAMCKTYSLDAPRGNRDVARTLASKLIGQADEDPYGTSLENLSIDSAAEAALALLASDERRVVELRFGIGGGREHTYSEVAQLIGVSPKCVRQILVRARCRMRTPRLRMRFQSILA
jgi:RNA polymerase sigma factor (sigma-70 family)